MIDSVRPTVLPDVSPVLVSVLKFAERLDYVDVLPRPRHHKLRALVQAVIEHLERFEHVAPVFALVVQSLVENVHYLVEGGRAVAENNEQSFPQLWASIRRTR
jgi:hypothetical protein